MKVSELIDEVGRPVAYFPKLRALAGSINAALLLCQLLYWHGKQRQADGWIFKRVTAAADSLDGAGTPLEPSLEDETGLTYREQARARRQLRELGLLEERYARSQHRIYFRLDFNEIQRRWEELHAGCSPESRGALDKTASGNAQPREGQGAEARVPLAASARGTEPKRESLIGTGIEYSETTAENTAESPTAAAAADAHRLPSMPAAGAVPGSPLEALRHPEIQLFLRVCGRVPGMRDYRLVIETMVHFRQLKGDQVVQYLRPFWLAWSSRRRRFDRQPYDPGSLTWLTEWAINGVVPPDTGGFDATDPGSAGGKNRLTRRDLAAAARINRRRSAVAVQEV